MKEAIYCCCMVFLAAAVMGGCSEPAPDPVLIAEEEPVREDRSEEGAGKTGEEISEEIEEAMGEVADLLSELFESHDEGEPAHLEDLEALLPEDVDGLEVVVTDHRRNLIGLGMADVSATYADEFREISIEIIDTGSLAPFASKFNAWLGEEIDRENNHGFERTRLFRPRSTDYPAFESFTRTRTHAECAILIWVADRFFVAVDASGEEVSMDDCTDARDEVSFRRLERLALSLEKE